MAFYRKRGTKWEYRISYIDRSTGKQREKTKSGFKTKKEAQLAAVKAEADINYFGFAEDGNELVSKYFEEWLEVYKKPHLKPITYTLQERNVRLNIIPRWGKYKLREIKRAEYQKWINELRDHYSEGTVRRIHSIMNTAMWAAVRDFNVLQDNSIQRIKIPKDETNKEKVSHFSTDELSRFLEASRTPVKKAKYQDSIQYYALFAVISRTGLRIGEALALEKTDFDEKEKTLDINKTLVYPLNSTPYISTPKSKKSVRKVKLDDFTVSILKRHFLNQKELYLKHKNFNLSDTLIFHSPEGRWLRTNVVREHFKTLCKRAGVPVLSPHALRHTHAVHLLESGANIKYVSERLGHASIKTTADTYLHVTKKIEDDALLLYEKYVQL